jgi:hypothetical protein
MVRHPHSGIQHRSRDFDLTFSHDSLLLEIRLPRLSLEQIAFDRHTAAEAAAGYGQVRRRSSESSLNDGKVLRS